MKKNVMMRIASVLLIAVLLTTSAVSGTYAKYVTDGTSQDTARVAKFGVIVTGSNNIFNQWYTTHDTSLTSDEAAKVGANSVISSNADNVLAPGTNGALADFTIEGQPEVAVRVSYALTQFNYSGWQAAGGEYFPIIFTINGTDYYIGTGETIEQFKTRLESVIATFSEVYDAGTILDTEYNSSLEVSWRWNFEAGSWPYQTDSKDTELGNVGGAALDIIITATVEQID